MYIIVDNKTLDEIDEFMSTNSVEKYFVTFTKEKVEILKNLYPDINITYMSLDSNEVGDFLNEVEFR